MNSIAWLPHHSPAILPIPGTATVAHLEENVAAGRLELSDEQVARLGALVSPSRSRDGQTCRRY